jgi:hypothetical protein
MMVMKPRLLIYLIVGALALIAVAAASGVPSDLSNEGPGNSLNGPLPGDPPPEGLPPGADAPPGTPGGPPQALAPPGTINRCAQDQEANNGSPVPGCPKIHISRSPTVVGHDQVGPLGYGPVLTPDQVQKLKETGQLRKDGSDPDAATASRHDGG